MQIPLKSQDGVTLLTKKKYCGENIDIIPELQVKEAMFSDVEQSITPDPGYAGLKEVKVEAIPDFDKYVRTDKENTFTETQIFEEPILVPDTVIVEGSQVAVNAGIVKEALDKKRDKIIPDNTYTRVYSQNKDGTDTSIAVSSTTTPGAGSIPLRNSNGNIVGNSAQANTEYTPLSQVNAIANKKVDKLGAGSAARLYGADKDGEQIAYGVGTGLISSYAIPQRTTNGQITAPDQSQYDPSPNQYISRKFGDANYVNKNGDSTITGNLSITGDLTVKGTTTTESEKQLMVEANVIATNSNKVDLQTLLSGLAINKNPNSTYGIMYDPTDDTVKFGEGKLDDTGKFTFNSGEGHPLAIRADSSKFVDAHLVKWDEASMSFVDAGVILMGGDNGANNAIQQAPVQPTFINTNVGYTKNDPAGTTVGKDAYGAYIDPTIYNNTDNTTTVENSGENTIMLGGLSHNAGATPITVRPGYTGDASQSFIFGRRNINVGDYNTVFNTDNIVYGDNCFIGGLRNISLDNETTILGTALISTQLRQIVMGYCNEPDNTSRFMIGGGWMTQHTDGTNPDGSKKYVLDSITRRTIFKVSETGDTYAYGKMSARLAPTDGIDVVRLTDMNTALNVKLDKLDPATNSLLYGITPEGRNIGFVTGTANINKYAIPQRMDGGQIKLPTQTGTSNTPEDDQAISTGYTKILIEDAKKDIQSNIDTKRDKITTPHGTDVVYTQTADGVESSSPISHAQYANSLPTRDTECRVNVSIDCGKPNDRPSVLNSYDKTNYLQFLRGTPEEWAAYDVPLMDGEVALLKRQNGRRQIRIGTGANKFSELKNVGDITVKNNASSYGTLEAGVEYRITTIEDNLVEYFFENTTGSVEDDLYSILVFDTPATAIEFATDEDAKLTGDNCKNGVFTPTPNTHYTVYFWYDGTKQGFVRGVPTDGGTWVSDKPTIGTSTSSTDLKKIVYTADADIPTTPEEGVEYACTDLIGEADLDPTFINKVNSKQNLLTFDTAPTSGSTNPVTSGGIYDAISKFLTIQVSDSLMGG